MAANPNQPTLIVRSRDGTTATLPLTRQPVVLGRAAGCDVVLRNDGGVSREHADVWLDESGCVLVRDRGSKNGTRVDTGEPFRDAIRPVNRVIRIGEYEIELVGLGPRPAALVIPEIPPRFAADPSTQFGDTRFFPSSKRLDLNLHRLTLLMSLTERIGGAFDRKQLLEQALGACCEALGFERGLIALKTTRGDPELPVTRNIDRDETGAYQVSRTLINQALVHGERAVVNNPATDLVDNLSDSLVRFPICSALCVPILHRDEILGVIYGDRITQASTYSTEDVDFLAGIAQQVGVGLANLRLFQEHLRAQKVYLELEQARTIQQRLLPARSLAAGRIAIAGYNEPSSAVGGDYFDYFDLGDGHIGLIISDVTGHGLPAALMMANFQAAVRVALTGDVPLARVAERLNDLICRNTDSDVFITAIIGRIDPRTATIEYVSAGHHGPVLLRGRQAEQVEPETSLPLGIELTEKYKPQVIEADPEMAAILFYTDGLIEAENGAGEMFGTTNLLRALTDRPLRTTPELLRATLDAVQRFAAGTKVADDLTLLGVEIRDGGLGVPPVRS